MPVTALDGPRRPPASGRPARQLVVLLHGYGANGDDLIGLGDAFSGVLPDAAFVAPDAPAEIPGYPMGRQWFPLATRGLPEVTAGAEAARPLIDAFLDTELRRLGLADSVLVLIGFSQGTMLALHTGLRRASPPAGIVGFSGLLPQAPPPGIGRPPVLLVHGERDEMIAAAALPAARDALAAAGVPVEAHLRPGLGHGIDEGGLRLAAAFLKRVLPT